MRTRKIDNVDREIPVDYYTDRYNNEPFTEFKAILVELFPDEHAFNVAFSDNVAQGHVVPVRDSVGFVTYQNGTILEYEAEGNFTFLDEFGWELDFRRPWLTQMAARLEHIETEEVEFLPSLSATALAYRMLYQIHKKMWNPEDTYHLIINGRQESKKYKEWVAELDDIMTKYNLLLTEGEILLDRAEEQLELLYHEDTNRFVFVSDSGSQLERDIVNNAVAEYEIIRASVMS